MLSLPGLQRRVRRLLPAGLEIRGLLPLDEPMRWESSPLSRLALGGRRRGVLGLRLAAAFAADVLRNGLRMEHGSASRLAPRYLAWQALPARGGFWCRSEDGEVAVLVDAEQGTAWLFWQDSGLVR